MDKQIRWYKTHPEATAVLQVNIGNGWQCYKSHPHYSLINEHPSIVEPKRGHYMSIPGMTPGYKTFQALLRMGYQVLDQKGNPI